VGVPDALIAGLFTGLSLIVAIGAQNAFVLRQGLAREHIGAVVFICSASDLLLIAAGVGGVGAVVRSSPTALTVVRWLGVAFLTAYGVRSLWRAARRSDRLTAASRDEPRLRGAVFQALALTWLNPHVYLDTVLLIGSIAAHHGPTGRWWFAVGAGLASIVWFVGLGYGARLLAPLLSRPRAWQVLDVLIGVVMLTIAFQLAGG
jgi:L-lysine exporter family protein LysE/ArgO